jgi:hypothetical protein
MTNFSINPGMVRVDYFKDSGKWYMTEEHDMSGHWDDAFVQDAVRRTLKEAGRWLPHFTMVVLEPYHRSAFPVMFVANDSRSEHDIERTQP